MRDGTEATGIGGGHPLPAGALLDSPPPRLAPKAAAALARDLYGIEAAAHPLSSERDANLRLDAADGRRFVLKVANPAEPPAQTSFQTEALLEIERRDPDLPVPRVLRALDGRREVPLALDDGRTGLLRVLSWVEGEPVARIGVSRGLRRDLGRTLARLGAALSRFEHPADSHDLLWDVRHAPRLRPLAAAIPDEALRGQVEAELDRFEARVAPRLPALRSQVVHNDLNHHNVVVSPAEPDRVAGVLDFGDMVRTPLAIDVAVAASYLTTGADDPVAAAADLVAAYHETVPLRPEEVGLLRDLIVARLIASVAITSWRARRYPENAAYILRNNAAARAGLARFATLPPEAVARALRSACGME